MLHAARRPRSWLIFDVSQKMSRVWRVTTDSAFLAVMLGVSGWTVWQLFAWWKAPVSRYPNAREAFGVLSLLALAAYAVYSVVHGYFSADEDSGRVPSTIWIVLGIGPFVGSLISPMD